MNFFCSYVNQWGKKPRYHDLLIPQEVLGGCMTSVLSNKCTQIHTSLQQPKKFLKFSSKKTKQNTTYCRLWQNCSSLNVKSPIHCHRFHQYKLNKIFQLPLPIFWFHMLLKLLLFYADKVNVALNELLWRLDLVQFIGKWMLLLWPFFFHKPRKFQCF